MKEEVPNRPDDISVEAWELAYDTNHALWAVCDDDPDDVKFWQDTKVIAHALLHARSQAYEELRDPTEEMIAAALDVDLGNEDERSAVINLWHSMISQAIRQHSQKGEDNEGI